MFFFYVGQKRSKNECTIIIQDFFGIHIEPVIIQATVLFSIDLLRSARIHAEFKNKTFLTLCGHVLLQLHITILNLKKKLNIDSISLSFERFFLRAFVLHRSMIEARISEKQRE